MRLSLIATLLGVCLACDGGTATTDTEPQRDTETEASYPIQYTITSTAEYAVGYYWGDQGGITCEMDRTFWLTLEEDGTWEAESDGWQIVGDDDGLESCNHSTNTHDREVYDAYPYDGTMATMSYACTSLELEYSPTSMEVLAGSYICAYQAETSGGTVDIQLTLGDFDIEVSGS